MNMGLIGLGRMGNSIAYRALQAGHTIFGFDIDQAARNQAQAIGVTLCESIEAVAKDARVIWLMLPAGDLIDAVLKQLLLALKPGDIVIDGGNSWYRDSINRAQALSLHEMFFLDCGTSGGVHGRAHGFCLMVGGDQAAYTKVHQLLVSIAAPGGVGYIGRSGTGHYVKMVHNGIEYGLMQAYAEGFHVIKEGSFASDALDLEEISRLWQTSSVIRGWLLELIHQIVAHDQEFHSIGGSVGQSGTGLWTVNEAREHKIPVPVIADAVAVRDWSAQTGGNFATKMIALIRNKFGDHRVEIIKEKI